MKRNPGRFIQRREPQQAKSRSPFFSTANREINNPGPVPFFRKQANEGEKDENIRKLNRAVVEEDKNKVNKTEPDENRKENTPAMKQAQGTEDKQEQKSS